MTDKLRAMLEEAVLQLEYLNEKEQRGTTNAVITRARAALAAAPQSAGTVSDAAKALQEAMHPFGSRKQGLPAPEHREPFKSALDQMIGMMPCAADGGPIMEPKDAALALTFFLSALAAAPQPENGDALSVLSGISSYLGAGMGDENTTPAEFDQRIRWGIDNHVSGIIASAADTVERLSKRPNTTWGEVKAAVAALAAAPQPAPAWNGPGEKPHTYSPDYQAMGDCRICGHDHEAHKPAPQPAPERSELDALRKVNSELIRENARLIAAPQPAPMDREALVEVIREAIQPSIISDVIPALAADALLARGLRLPGDETMAWAVVGEDGEVIPGSIYPTRDEAERVCDYEGERVVPVTIRVVEGGDDAA